MNQASKSTVEKHFDEIFLKKPQIEYDFNLKNMGRKDKKIIECLLNFGVKDRICLDAGPGSGRWLQFLKKNNAKDLYAIDISQASLDRCKQFCTYVQKLDFEYNHFDFENNSFDISLSIEVMDHLRNPSIYLSEMVRVTKKDGIILMSVTNFVSLISRIRMAVGLFPVAVSVDKTHFGFYRKKDISGIFAKYGLKPKMIPTSISLNPNRPKSKLSIPSNRFLSSFDDCLLFMVEMDK